MPCSDAGASAASWAAIVKKNTEPTPGLLFPQMSPPRKLAEILADGQAQACTAVAARGRGIALHERIEQTVQLVRLDPDARVAHGHVDLIGVRGRLYGPHQDDHLPLRGELDRVRDEVDQDLPQPRRIRHERRRHLRVDVTGQVDAFFSRLRGQQIDSLGDAGAQVEGVDFEFDVPGFDLRKI